MLTDTHCHLDFNVFENDREEVIDRAREAGICRILNPGIDIVTSRSAIAIAEQHEEIFASVGVHPNSALSWNQHTLDELMELATHPKVVAIGEIGLDFYRDRAPQQLQLDIFNDQLELAERVNLPVVIHNRQASDRLFDRLHDWCASLRRKQHPLSKHPGVLHSFSGSKTLFEQALADNFLIGITGPVTFNNAMELQTVVSQIPSGDLLIETDAPFLTPHPYRGSRNEPVHVRLVADKIAQLQGTTIKRIAEDTTANSNKLFNWREPVD